MASAAYLIPLSGPQRLVAFPIGEGEHRIGRAPDCDIRLDDPYVSAHHAALHASEGVYVIVDTASSSGVFLTSGGARQVSRCRIGDQDTFVCGRTTLQLRLAR